MLFKAILLPSVLLPAAVALIALVANELWSRRRPSKAGDESAGRGAAPAVSLALAAAYVAMNGWPRFWPVEATQRWFFFALLAIPVSLLMRSFSDRTRLTVFFVLSVPLYRQLFESQLEHRWSSLEGWAWIGALSAASVAVAAAWSRSVSRPRQSDHDPRAQSLWSAIIRPTMLGATAICLGLSGSALLGQLMGALAVAVGTVEAWQVLRQDTRWHRSDGLVWSVACCGLISCGYFYADLQPVTAGLLLAGLLLLSFHRAGASLTTRSLCLVPFVLAAALTVGAELDQLEENGDEYDYYGSNAAERREDLLS